MMKYFVCESDVVEFNNFEDFAEYLRQLSLEKKRNDEELEIENSEFTVSVGE